MKLSELQPLLETLSFRPSKMLGQNFLHDANVARAIVAHIDPKPDEAIVVEKLQSRFIRRNNLCSEHMEIAVKDTYKRLLCPSMESESRSMAKARADEAGTEENCLRRFRDDHERRRRKSVGG
jgi:hypothetical protein